MFLFFSLKMHKRSNVHNSVAMFFAVWDSNPRTSVSKAYAEPLRGAYVP
jgi:hypothetical protein